MVSCKIHSSSQDLHRGRWGRRLRRVKPTLHAFSDRLREKSVTAELLAVGYDPSLGANSAGGDW